MTPSLTSRIGAAWRCLRGDAVARRPLPARREALTTKFELGTLKWHMTWSSYPDGAPAEVFLSAGKSGDLLRWMSNDAAVVLSIALQYGVPPGVLRAALIRDQGGEPLSPLAYALDVAMGDRR